MRKSLLHPSHRIQTSHPFSSPSSIKFISSLSLPKTLVFAPQKHAILSHPFKLFNFSMLKPTIQQTKIIHAQIITTGFQSDTFSANTIADLYCKSGAMYDARQLFDRMSQPNLVSWNLMISGYNQSLQFDKSWEAFRNLHSYGLEPDQFTYGSILSACAASQSLQLGKQLHSLVTKNGFLSDGYVGTAMVDLFTKSRCFADALKVFSEFPCANVVSWNAIITGSVRNRENSIAVDLFCRMLDRFLIPNPFTFSSVLTACAGIEELELGKEIHGWVIKCGAEDDVFVGTAMVDMYAKCGEIDGAVKEFFQMPDRNVVTWTAIISGFILRDDSVSALRLFKEMIRTAVPASNFTVTSILSGCSKSAMAEQVIQIHCWIIKTGFFMDSKVKGALINTYAKCGEIGFSEKVFREIGFTDNEGTWAAMMSGFAQNQMSERSIRLFQKMVSKGLKPDTFACSSVLSVTNCVELGKQIHSYVVKSSLQLAVTVGSSLFTMYSKCGSLEDSYKVFDEMPKRDGVAWTSMIAGFSEYGHSDHAFQLLRDMILEGIKLDHMTLSASLTACSSYQYLRKGKEIHGFTIRSGIGTETMVGGALVNMYSKCGTVVSACKVFDEMPRKDQVSWSTLVSCYAQNGFREEALATFHQMLIAGFEIDNFTISTILSVSATLTTPGLGKQFHSCSIKTGLEFDIMVSSSLVTMYSKCGSIEDSRMVFDRILKPDLVSWTSMISGYAQHGLGLEALEIYEKMREEGTKPDSVTFVGILTACSHNGLVEQGYLHLQSMINDYGIEPEAHHYACMVDLLSRSGRLEEAANFIDKMPIKPDALVWGTLLGACRVHGDVEMGRFAARKVLELDPRDAGALTSLSNICAGEGNWEEVSKIRNLMKGASVQKEPGYSFV